MYNSVAVIFVTKSSKIFQNIAKFVIGFALVVQYLKSLLFCFLPQLAKLGV